MAVKLADKKLSYPERIHSVKPIELEYNVLASR